MANFFAMAALATLANMAASQVVAQIDTSMSAKFTWQRWQRNRRSITSAEWNHNGTTNATQKEKPPMDADERK